ncbi:ABC transporter permease [Lacipirellula limnantheis]|uniref:Lipoprotein-releasing system transmembrane protein LolC n=1 Tax=Lacipirellula limnantheis TaxID=2528024 RepID=A0A517TVU9_9BACT|nr:FtsX-like permease family protein [Lacipirellula limnantheis]QDT72501.1 Lipoprotein-releasing system transmembrane protein LolC [Lacipirellula limnantheis]
MYKLLLCWRYLRTRYIALLCIVSVTLGVATMIVVNSVMAGFTHEMQGRLNGMLGDLIVRTRSLDGALDADAHMAKIRETVGDVVVGMSPTVHVPSLLYMTVGGESLPRQVTLIGIDEASYASVSQFGEFLQHPENRKQLSFNLRDEGYDVLDHQVPAEEAKPREVMRDAGWKYRSYKAMLAKQRAADEKRLRELREADAGSKADASATPATMDPFAAAAAASGEQEGRDFDPATEQHTGIVLGIGICGFRTPDGVDHYLGLPGDDVKVAFPLAVMPPEIVGQEYTVVDFYESKMSEYDANFAFVPLKALQKDRGMIDPKTGVGKFTTIQIKLKPGADADAIRDRLQEAFPQQLYQVSTWRDEQGALLAAVQMETAVLNVLLFMIIAVAGFGILAIFFMIVVEKTRDIGILKSLGASGWGILGIFLAYGLSLGIVGAGVGTIGGIIFVKNINEVADFLGWLTGQPVFDPSVYYFYKIPTIIEPVTVICIASGAMGIAILSSIIPAIRAASLHPVRALRFE